MRRRLEPRHRAGGDRAEHRLRRGTLLYHHVLEAMRVAGIGGSSTHRAAAWPRTSARPRRTKTRAHSCRSRPTAPASSRAVISAYSFMFGLLGTCVRASETWSGRCRPTASASTSCVRSWRTRPGSHPGRWNAEQVVHSRRRRDRRHARGERQQWVHTACTTSQRATTSRSRRSPIWQRVRRPRAEGRPVRVHGWRTRLEGRCTRGSALDRAHPWSRLGTVAHVERRCASR